MATKKSEKKVDFAVTLKNAYHDETKGNGVVLAAARELAPTLHGQCEKVVDVARKLEVDAKQLAGDIAKLTAQKRELESMHGTARDVIASMMRQARVGLLKLPNGTISLSKTDPKLVVVDIEKVPEELTKTVTKPDLKAAKAKMMTEGGTVPDGFGVEEGRWFITVRS